MRRALTARPRNPAPVGFEPRGFGRMWFHFFDMHSGGNAKTAWDSVYVEAGSRDDADVTFELRTGVYPRGEACACCGPDYAVLEHDTLEDASAYERGRREYPKPAQPIALAEYLERADVLVLRGQTGAP